MTTFIIVGYFVGQILAVGFGFRLGRLYEWRRSHRLKGRRK